MPKSQWNIFRQREFTGGENRKLLPEFAKPNQWSLALNTVMTADGVVETREGKVKINNVSLGSGGILSAFIYPKEDGTNYIVAQHGTSLYAETWDGSSIVTFGAAVKTGLTADSKLRGVVWKDNLILTNGDDNMFRFDGTSCTDLGGSPTKSRWLAVYAGRLWYGDVANPNFIRFSGLEDYDTHNALDVIKVRDGDGDFITGAAAVDGGLVVFKTQNVYPIFGTNRFNLRLGERMLDGVGCPSFDGYLSAGIFAGLNQFYTFNISEINPMPDTHGPLLDLLTGDERSQVLVGAQNSTSRAHFLLPSGEIVVFDAKYGAATSWSGLNVGCFCQANAEGMNGELIIGDADDGYLYMLNGLDDDGALIETFLKTPYNDMESPRDKVWRSFMPDIEYLQNSSDNYNISARYDIDFDKYKGLEVFSGTSPNVLTWGTDSWGEAVWGASEPVIDVPYWIHGVRGQLISFELRTFSRIRFKGYETKFREAGAI